MERAVPLTRRRECTGVSYGNSSTPGWSGAKPGPQRRQTIIRTDARRVFCVWANRPMVVRGTPQWRQIMAKSKDVTAHESIHPRFFVIRGHKVMLDFDLAKIYGVETKVLNQVVTRNKDRFPSDFMFVLDAEEWECLRSQIVTSKSDARGGRQYAPRAFTEQGVAMLSSVLRSKRAVAANIQIMRTFVQMREAMLSHKDLAMKIEAMERRYDHNFKAVFDALRQLIEPPAPKKRPIGFNHPYEDEDKNPKGRRR